MRPTVKTQPTAWRYGGPDERVVKVEHELGECLISISPQDDGELRIEVYAATGAVNVMFDPTRRG